MSRRRPNYPAFRFNPSVRGRQGRALFTKSTACIDTETETWASIAHLLRVVVRTWYRAKHDREIWEQLPPKYKRALHVGILL